MKPGIADLSVLSTERAATFPGGLADRSVARELGSLQLRYVLPLAVQTGFVHFLGSGE